MIFLTNETIREDSEALVSPELDHITLSFNGLGRCLGNTLEDLGHVSQVIGIVRLGRGWSELDLNHLVNCDCVVHNVVSLTFDTT
jgi:hypothetical protein